MYQDIFLKKKKTAEIGSFKSECFSWAGSESILVNGVLQLFPFCTHYKWQQLKLMCLKGLMGAMCYLAFSSFCHYQ